MLANRQFKFGDVVRWRSGSSYKLKQGVVVIVVPAKTRPKSVSEYGGGMTRDHESYVVQVAPPEGSRAACKTYWPRVSALQLVEGVKC